MLWYSCRMEMDAVIKAPILPDLRPFVNKWIVLSPDRSKVISSGDSIEEATSGIESADKKNTAVMKVLPAGYSPAIR